MRDSGLADDRHWMLVRPNGRFVTQRELPRMALIGTAVDSETLTLNAPGMPALSVARSAAGETRGVTVWKFSGSGIDCGDAAARWASDFLATPLRLVRFDAQRAARMQSRVDRRHARHHRILRRLPDPGDFARFAGRAQFTFAQGAAHGALPARTW